MVDNEQQNAGRQPRIAASTGISSSTGALAWPLALAVGLGLLAGLGAYTFSYAKGFSYFSTDPKACVNCHIMQPQFDAWQKSSHHSVAVCVDCHLPQSFVPKYVAKAENGWRHGEKFTTQNFHEPIYVKRSGLRILQDNCVRCHRELTSAILGGERPGSPTHPAHAGAYSSDTLYCIHCHAAVGHGERAGLGGPQRSAERETGLPTKPLLRPRRSDP